MSSKPQRNDPCPCGSGKKFKKCCGQPGMGSRTASILNSSPVSSSLLGRISQAGSSFSKDRKFDVMTKNVSLGKPNPQDLPPEKPPQDEKKSDSE